jgi:heterodisulfide reductase subunit A-like polyferredoxin
MENRRKGLLQTDTRETEWNPMTLSCGCRPAGLKCAEVLGGTGLSILVLEKNNTIGQKTCAGGLSVLDRKFPCHSIRP